jgi:hypothetical protein
VASAATLALVPLAGTAQAAGASVIKGECGLDAGDIPGFPAFPLERQTLVIAPDGNGELVISCRGTMPENLTLSETFQGDITCFGDRGIVTGHVVATPSGQVSYQCRFVAQGG